MGGGMAKKRMARGGAAKKKASPKMMRGGGMAKKVPPKMMRGGGMAKKRMKRGGKVKK